MIGRYYKSNDLKIGLHAGASMPFDEFPGKEPHITALFNIIHPLGNKLGLNVHYQPTLNYSQFDKWQQQGYLNSSFPAISADNTVVEWEDTSQDLEERVRSYIDINCGHCHAEGSHCSYRPMRFAYSETSIPENLGICVEPEEEIPGAGQTFIVSSADVARSMIYYRLNSTSEEVRMPLLGRTIIHDEAVQLIEQWIATLDPPCN